MSVVVDGFDLGNEPADVAVVVGGQSCANPTICHRMCESCNSDLDCDTGKTCIALRTSSTGPAKSVCAPVCDANGECPCGTQCFPVQRASGQSVFFMCLNGDILDDAPLCSDASKASYKPAPGMGNSRIECDLPPGFCPAAGFLDVVVSDSRVDSQRSASTGLAAGISNLTEAVVAPGFSPPAAVPRGSPPGSSAPLLPSEQLRWPWGGGGVFRNSAEASAAGLAPSGGSWPFERIDNPAAWYSRPLPVAAFFGSPGFCATDADCLASGSPGAASLVAGIDGVCYSAKCLAGCCAAVPTGRCQSAPEASALRDLVGDRQFLPLPRRSAALLPMPVQPVGTLPQDMWSPVSEVDDSPLDRLPLGFAFPFYSTSNVSTLFLGANGYVKVTEQSPCGGYFGSGACTIRTGYRGIIGPLISDWNPAQSATANVYVRNATDFVCVRWDRLPLFSFAPEPTDPRWTTTMCIFPDGSVRFAMGDVPGPPNSTEWFSGIRALGESPAEARDGALDVARGFVTGASAMGDVALDDATSVEMAASSVRTNAQAGFCSVGTVACLSPRCGPPGTVVRVHWPGFGCGIGLGATSSGARLLCIFGKHVVEASVISSSPSSTARTGDPSAQVAECVVPLEAAELDSSAGSEGPEGVTIPVTLALALPVNATVASADLARDLAALNASGWQVTAGRAGAGTEPRFASVGGPAPDGSFVLDLSQGRRKLAESLGTGLVVAAHTLMFTVLPANSSTVCGCDMSPLSSCDQCGICNGGGRGVDCTGRCLGAAAVDDCGVCSGGTTGKTANAAKDCNGICFGPGVSCPTPSPTPGFSALPSPALPSPPGDDSEDVVVVVVVLLSVLALVVGGACGIAARAMLVRQQQEEQAFAEAEMVPVRRGLANHQLEQLPAIPFHKADCESVEARNTECIISMEEFSEGQFIMRLPCDHQLTYHLGVQYFSTATDCLAGFTGEACQRSACPSDCSGHGKCVSIRQMQAMANAMPFGHNDANYGGAEGSFTFDQDRIFGCVCDSRWPVGYGPGETQAAEYFGHDCSLKRCPSGDDPRTVRDTGMLAHHDWLDETNCHLKDRNGTVWRGQVDADGNPDYSSNVPAAGTVVHGTVPPAGQYVNAGAVGNKCHVSCSNRGVCDHQTGTCSCMAGSYGEACQFLDMRAPGL
ncbi:hypothetical protein FNF28_00986 [Cafeteria roenbergensis]|uniref:EGF-like domain-containing protein n=1 Tax=Cafeteria roenbergensis TaxID=33653 RepID=A0A5A8E5I0_CAFRO|nr:hypothetical protein FNF28_00986 [Cafeteria roenbergensis]